MLRSTGVALAEPLDTGPLVRERFSFDPDGRYAACLAGDGGSGLAVEMWTFIHRESRRILPTLGGETLRTQPVPTGDGRVVLLRNGSGLHHLVLLEPDADGARERAVACLEAPGVRLIPSPDPGTLALAVASHVDRTTVWRIPATHPQLERLLEVPGSFGGGLWLDGAGRVLGVNRRVHDRVVPAFADLHRGSLSVLPTVSASSNDHLLLSSPRSGRTLVASDAAGELRLGLGVLDGSAPVRFPAALNRLAGTAEPLAFDPAGQQVALKVNRGARSDLLVYEAGADRIREVAIPAGTIRGVGSWGWSGLRFPFSAPDQPTGLGTVDGIGSWSVAGPTGRRGSAGWIQARLEQLDAPAGPIEAVVYGGPNWRKSPRLVVALHDGPEAAWRFEFDALFQRLAATGVAVLAPNQRGSTGYGPAHSTAVDGAWGVPDLADIRYLASTLARQRRAAGLAAPALYGVGYGGFLALLSAGCDPDLWSRCAVVAPFMSGPGLYREASAPVRSLLERLGGCTEADDEVGSRDVWRLCPRISVPLLIVHGAGDDVVPVGQSRQLRQRLVDLGRREGTDFTYIEVPGRGHSPLTDADGDELARKVVRFLRADRP